jgi:PAS domain S-box-containing protein
MWRLSAELMLVGDLKSGDVAVNPAWESVLGWPQESLTAEALDELLHPDDREDTLREIEKLHRGVPVVRYENRFRARDGVYRRIAWTAVPEEGFFHALGRDITEEQSAAEALRRTEEALRQSQKMEAVGQLTGGIAHDFNNMLAIVIGGLDLAQRRIERGQDAQRHLEAAREGALRAAGLTQRLLAFSRRQPLSPKVVNLNRLVGGMSELLNRTLGETVTLETELHEALWPVYVDPNQMESALLNLAVNARDAMPEGGRLTVRTANLTAAEARAVPGADLEAADHVVISVSDRGAGMPPEVLARAFEPFFTTKPVGKGTGLGLSMVYGFVRQSDGEVAIDSRPGEGATVSIYLPRCSAAAPEAAAAQSAPPPRAAGAETVLVVEDEDEVREMSVAALAELGYRVRAAASGEEALQVLETLPGLDLLFTDVVMPGMSGRQLATAARASAPGLKVLYTTGYTPDALTPEAGPDRGVALLSKPFSIAELADKVRAVLDG